MVKRVAAGVAALMAACAVGIPAGGARPPIERFEGGGNYGYDVTEAGLLGSRHAREHFESALSATALTPPARAVRMSTTDPAVVGSWSAPQQPKGGIVAIHSVLLSTGRVLIWSVRSTTIAGYVSLQAVAAVYDPTTGKERRVDPPVDMNIFCGYQTILQDGRVLVVGGLNPDHGWSGEGIPVVLTFDPATETWTVAPPMRHGRWYPSIVTMADGNALVIGGHEEGGKNIPNPDLEVIRPDGSAPTLVGSIKLGAGEDVYPAAYQLPDGRIFSFAGKLTNWIDPTTWRISNGPVVLAREYLYPNGTLLPFVPGGDALLLMTGGRTSASTLADATTTSARIDLSVANPKFTAMTPLPQPRTNANTVLLPDGTMALVGGNITGAFGTPTEQTLLYDPTTDVWTPAASQTMRRAYHSTALLLPDGRVLSGGDNGVGGGNSSLEFYSPPYLFRGPRPVVTGAPATAPRGSAIAVTTDVHVAHAVLIAPGAVTHASNLHQREIQLATTPGATSGLTAVVPADGTTPPGIYMLFVLSDDGVPAIARWITIT